MSSADLPAAVASPRAAPSRILPANLLFLISLVLVLTVGTAAQIFSIWPGLIVTEIFCILLPAWIFARATESAAEALRLEWVGIEPCALALVTGVALWPAAGAVGMLAEKILPYRFALPDSFWPEGVGGAATYALASVIAAPFCEEMLFRGYILGAYERAGWRPRTAILGVAALFTAYHVSPMRAPGVAVLAVALTFIAWRTGSVWPSIAGHIGANGAAAVLAIAGGRRMADQDLSPRTLVMIAIPAAVLAGVCIRRICGRDTKTPAPLISRRGGWWPLWIAGTIIALAAGAEIAIKTQSGA